MTEQIRVGVIGTSWWSDILILPSLSNHPQANIVAICGRNVTRTQEVATKHDIPKIFTNYQEMIETGELQAVVVASPDDLHYPMTMVALDAGLHVLCEKPLANSADEARKMYEKAEATGVKHMTMYSWRWMPHFQHLRNLVKGGYIGRTFHVDFRFIMGNGRSGDYGWRFDNQRANGVLGDLGSHMIDLARWFVGEIVTVQAHLATFIDRPGIDGRPLDPANDSAFLTVGFANGEHGAIQASSVANIGDRFVQHYVNLYGESGTLQADVIFDGVESGAVIQGTQHSENQFQQISTPPELWVGLDSTEFNVNQIPKLFMTQSIGPRLFIDAILEDKPVTPNFYDGFKTQEVVDAALFSHQTGSRVSLPQSPHQTM